MVSRQKDRLVEFAVRDDYLVRTVTFPGGRSYEHRCPLAAYTAVAYAVDESPREGMGLTLERLADALPLPYTQVNVALEFLKERGVLAMRGRRSYPAGVLDHTVPPVWRSPRSTRPSEQVSRRSRSSGEGVSQITSRPRSTPS